MNLIEFRRVCLLQQVMKRVMGPQGPSMQTEIKPVEGKTMVQWINADHIIGVSSDPDGRAVISTLAGQHLIDMASLDVAKQLNECRKVVDYDS